MAVPIRGTAKAVEWGKLTGVAGAGCQKAEGGQPAHADSHRGRTARHPRRGAAEAPRDERAPADHRRSDRRAARVALATLPGRLRDVLGDEERAAAPRLPISPTIATVLASQPRIYPWVFTNSRTGKPYTSNGVGQVFGRAVARAGISRDDVTLHTLRHTALSRMIAGGHDDYTVMEISGHSSTRMLARYTHPTEGRKIEALNLDYLGTKRAQHDEAADDDSSTASEIAELLKGFGGRREARTRDLRVANAALSQLS